jgi:hypothetical protein
VDELERRQQKGRRRRRKSGRRFQLFLVVAVVVLLHFLSSLVFSLLPLRLFLLLRFLERVRGSPGAGLQARAEHPSCRGGESARRQQSCGGGGGRRGEAFSTVAAVV